MAQRTKTPELLAPAGNVECLHAAVCGGADAVYLGLEEFNARRNAGNFTLSALKKACDYAHLRGVSVYVAMNVEILPGEIDRAIACAAAAYEAGADALIVQDVGLAAELRRTAPEVELHVSTQMNVHSAAGVEMGARLGAKRITFARELSIAEIAELTDLATAFGMDAECFVHGALCICYSGQCLMSSMIGGRSANRGLCAQACRLPYELHRVGRERALPSEGAHLLSPRDLCAIDLLDQLADAGVASLKIEGRMKSTDYVFEVTSVYRESLDELESAPRVPENPDAIRHRKARLAEAFSRGFTTAYLEGKRGNEIMSYGRPNNRGVFAGRVMRVQDGIAEIAPEIELHEGDILEFWTNKGHFSAEVPPETATQSPGERCSTVHIPIEQRAGKGDRVFRVRNAATAFTMLADDPFAPRIPVTGYATLRLGEPAHIRFATAQGAVGRAWGDAVERARTKALAREDVRAHIDRLGQTAFSLSGLEIDMDDGIGMGFSQLHRLRTDALNALADELLAAWHSRSPILHDVPTPRATPPRANTRACSVMAWATNPGCARAARRAGAKSVYVPLLNFRRGQAQIGGVRQSEAEQAGYPKQCVMALSTVEHDPLAQTRENATAFDPWEYVREGKAVFADSLAGAIRALDKGALVELGPHVPLTNAASLRYAAELGIHRAWLSPELTLGQIAELAEQSPVELGLFVSGAQELMICEHCLLMSQGECAEECERCPRRSVAHKLIDHKGFEFPLVTDALGRSHLYNGIELDAMPVIPDLIEMGITAIMVDTTLMDKKTAEAAVSRATRAIDKAIRENRSVDKRPNTTTGHLFRSVS